nr:hypothetical protein [Tanacetum cinerariifolium]
INLLNDYEDVGKLKSKGDIGVFVGYSKESAAFRIYNKRTRKIHESVNVNFDEISEMDSKQFNLEPGLSNLNETGISSIPSVSQVSKTSKKDLEDLFQNFYDEYFDSSKIMKSSTTNVETSNVEIPLNEEEVFHESSESFQEESSSSSLNDGVQQSSEEVEVPSSNTQSISNNMIPNVNEASTSHNVFNEHLEDGYFDASTSFHDPSNVHTFYQPYPHEKKWTKDHPLHKIIAEALKDDDWVSAMQDELDQFARLKVWRLVPRPEGKAIIKTKWIFNNKKDEITRIEAIRLFLAYDAHKDFIVFQMDVKIAFLNGILKEGVYVGQPPGLVSKQYPDHVYALDKALYGLKQAPRAWYDIMKSSTTNVETSNVEIPSHEEEVFHESSESFQEEPSSSSLNDDVQQSSKEVILPQTNTQLISNNMIPNVDEASTSHTVFNECLEDAYFDASKSFHDPSNVHTFYQPYPHEKKWTKDHPLHKIIGDPKSSVRIRGQLPNSCLFSCLLSSIEHANVAEALRDADWVNAMQEELDQFARLK